MSIIRNVNDWLIAEASKDWTTVNATIRQTPFSGYVGWVGYGNLGDEAVFQALKMLFPEYNLMPYRIAKPARFASKLSGQQVPLKNVVLGGGTLINQSPAWLDEAVNALTHNLPIFCLGTGVAPIASLDTPPNTKGNLLREWADIINMFAYAGVRGPLSQEYLKQVGLNVEVVGDTALSLSKKEFKKKKAGKTIGINISYGTDGVMYGEPERLLKEITRFVLELLKDDFKVKIFPIWKGDLDASVALMKLIDSPSVEIIQAFDSVDEYLKAISVCDIFIGQKLHATVFSTMLRIPSIMLEYRPKCLDYMRSIDMESYSLRTDTLTSQELISTFNRLNGAYSNVRNELNQRILFYKDLQQKRAQKIKKTLNPVGTTYRASDKKGIR